MLLLPVSIRSARCAGLIALSAILRRPASAFHPIWPSERKAAAPIADAFGKAVCRGRRAISRSRLGSQAQAAQLQICCRFVAGASYRDGNLLGVYRHTIDPCIATITITEWFAEKRLPLELSQPFSDGFHLFGGNVFLPPILPRWERKKLYRLPQNPILPFCVGYSKPFEAAGLKRRP